MQIIYRARDIADAHILASYLGAHDIAAHVGGHYLQGGLGEIGLQDTATVQVANDDVEAALALVKTYECEQREPTDTPAPSTPAAGSPLLIVALFLVSVVVLIGLVS